MPLYEFDCTDCSQTFEKLVRSSTREDEITCPNCGSIHVHRRLSTFAVRGGSPAASGSSAASCSPGGL